MEDLEKMSSRWNINENFEGGKENEQSSPWDTFKDKLEQLKKEAYRAEAQQPTNNYKKERHDVGGADRGFSDYKKAERNHARYEGLFRLENAGEIPQSLFEKKDEATENTEEQNAFLRKYLDICPDDYGMNEDCSDTNRCNRDESYRFFDKQVGNTNSVEGDRAARHANKTETENFNTLIENGVCPSILLRFAYDQPRAWDASDANGGKRGRGRQGYNIVGKRFGQLIEHGVSIQQIFESSMTEDLLRNQALFEEYGFSVEQIIDSSSPEDLYKSLDSFLAYHDGVTIRRYDDGRYRERKKDSEVFLRKLRESSIGGDEYKAVKQKIKDMNRAYKKNIKELRKSENER